MLLRGAVVAMALLVGACDTGQDGTIEGCATTFTGTFEGAESGYVTGRLYYYEEQGQGAWYFEMAFCPQDADCGDPASYWGCSEQLPTAGCLYAIDADGNISTPRGFPAITGTLNFDTCESEGTWTRSNNDMGTWSMRDPS